MIVKRITIEKFRLFQGISFFLGKRLTVIAGRNATQKTTLLGMLGQPFTIPVENPMYGAKTIDGYNFKSQFRDKFKLSPIHDVIGEHKWTLYFHQNIYKQDYYSVTSISRTQRGQKTSLRFWNAESRSKGAGYVQIPVYFLSLSRLFPIGESGKTKKIALQLTTDEMEYYERNYREILIIHSTGSRTSLSVEKGTSSNVFAGVNDDTHDIYTNSAGECNLSRIILAMMSFKRLKEQFGSCYNGGMLLIDELDATLFGYSQVKLIDYLLKASIEFNVQIVFTTHSPIILKRINDYQRAERKKNKKGNMPCEAYDCSIVYLTPSCDVNGRRVIDCKNICTSSELNDIINDINLTAPAPADSGINIYCEDQEARAFIEFALNMRFGMSYKSLMSFFDANLGWTNFVQLASKKIKEFTNNVIVLDGDVINDPGYLKKKQIIDESANFVLLPLTIEKDMFVLLKKQEVFYRFRQLYPNANIPNYDICFKDWPLDIIQYKTEDFKRWYQYILTILNDRNLLFKFWYSENEEQTNQFIDQFVSVFNSLADKRKLDLLIP